MKATHFLGSSFITILLAQTPAWAEKNKSANVAEDSQKAEQTKAPKKPYVSVQSPAALQKRAKEAQFKAMQINQLTHFNLDLMIECKMDEQCIDVKMAEANVDQALAKQVQQSIINNFRPNISMDQKLGCIKMLKQRMTGQNKKVSAKKYGKCWKNG